MLNIKITEPKDKKNVKGIVQIIHGFAERVEHYRIFMQKLSEFGYICIVHNQRGFGGDIPKSEQGIVEKYDYFLDDITTVRTEVMKKFPKLPVYMFAHSMGGNIGLTYLMTRPSDDYKKAVIEAPWIEVAKPFPKPVNDFISFLGKRSYKLRTSGKINMDDISRDKELVKEAVIQFPSHNMLSFRTYSAMVSKGKDIIKNAKNLLTPTLLTYGTDDKLVSVDAIKEFASNCGENVKTIEYDGGYHQLHHDIIREKVIKDIVDFLEK